MEYREFEALVKSRFPKEVLKDEFPADLYDIREVGEWLSQLPERIKNLKADEVEDFLIEFDVQVFSHLGFHLKSIKPQLKKMLQHYAQQTSEFEKSPPEKTP